jgi:hypothetical protein
MGVIIWWFLRPKPVQMNKQLFKNKMNACLLAGKGTAAQAGDLYLSGSTHSGGCRLGKIKGHAVEQYKIKMNAKKKIIDADGRPIVQTTGGFETKVIMHYFAFQSGGLITSLWRKPEIICCMDWLNEAGEMVYSHTALIGDVILRGNSPVRVNEFWFLDTQAADSVCDEYISTEILRMQAHLVLNETNNLVQAAIKSEPTHLKLLELEKQADKGIPFGNNGGGDNGDN